MLYLLQILFVIIEIFAFFNLAQAFCVKSDLSKKKRAIYLIGLSILSLLIIYYLQAYFLLKITCFVVTQCIFLNYYYNSPWFKNIGICFLYFVIVLALDSGAAYITMAIENYFGYALRSNDTLYFISSIISKFSLFVISYFIKSIHVKSLRNIRESSKEWIEISTFLLSSLLSLYLIFEMSLLTGLFTEWLVFISVFIVVGAIAVCEVTLSVRQAKFKERQLEQLRQKSQIEMQNVEFAMELYNTERKTTHDFNNHLIIINHLINNNLNEKASNYIDNLIGRQNKNHTIFNTGNIVIDALLTQKHSKITELNFHTKFVLGDLSTIPMTNEDIVVVLSNLFDNAIEATSHCSDERTIYFKFTQEDDILVLSMQNTTILKSTKHFASNKTTKKNKIKHGYGLQNIKYILKMYDYDYSIVVEDGWFKFVTLIE